MNMNIKELVHNCQLIPGLMYLVHMYACTHIKILPHTDLHTNFF